ncbi:hypothetical protein CY35_01G182900 [Sphagnum magellanicum]|nr:hypothetical protein CY35_01G182900 [Sphagnum magellanicum]KAH9576805.1 hypothetical protein CY35_01G182900 [Sphagnum magellanicum]
MYMSRIVKKRVWKAYSLRRSRQESLEEEEQRNRHYFGWRSRKEAGRWTKSVHIWRSRRYEEVAAGGTKLEDEQSSFTTRIAIAQQDELIALHYHLARVPSRIFFAISCGGSKRLITRLNRRKQSTVDGRGATMLAVVGWCSNAARYLDRLQFRKRRDILIEFLIFAMRIDDDDDTCAEGDDDDTCAVRSDKVSASFQGILDAVVNCCCKQNLRVLC